MSKKDKKKKRAKKKMLKKISLEVTQKDDSNTNPTIFEFILENPLSEASSSANQLKIDDSENDILSVNSLLKAAGPDAIEIDFKDSVDRAVESKIDKKSKAMIFKELEKSELPERPNENRARLQMQAPNRLYFYWSVKNNPFKTLNRALNETESYTLVAKLTNRTRNTEELFHVETEGNWWFDVEAGSDYRAEIGFYAPNRPYIRIVFSNDVQTPRKSPSRRRDIIPRFGVSANQFAKVLDTSGYKRDAFEVAFTGDDIESAETATQQTYFQLLGKSIKEFTVANGSDELRFVLLALASGHSLNDLKTQISKGLFEELEPKQDRLDSESVLSALNDNFDVFTDELFEEQDIGSAIYGASLVNFPKRIKKQKVPKSLLPKLSKPNPISSFVNK